MGMVGWVGPKNDLLDQIPHGKGQILWGGMVWHNVIYKENVALWFGCCVPVALCLDLSAVGTAQLVHVMDESILCREQWPCGLFSYYFEQSCLALMHIMQQETLHIIVLLHICGWHIPLSQPSAIQLLSPCI